MQSAAVPARHCPRNPRRITIAICALGWLCAINAGCADAVHQSGVKGIDEKISESEFQSFLSVIDSLPDKKLPNLPAMLLPTPHWKPERTLLVADLVEEENSALSERWTVKWVAIHLPKSSHLQRALRRERLKPEQFIGLALAIGAALGADAHDFNTDLTSTVARGERFVERLEERDTPFSSLSDEVAHDVLTQAAWLTVVDRAKRILAVPPENLALVRQHRERLDQIFPEELRRDPLIDLTNILEERGIPFKETPASGFDNHIVWDPRDAVVGTAATK